jgi:hypothetical protein
MSYYYTKKNIKFLSGEDTFAALYSISYLGVRFDHIYAVKILFEVWQWSSGGPPMQ